MGRAARTTVASDVARYVRRHGALSVAELAERSGVSRAQIRAVESGANQPTARTLARLVAGAGGRLRLGVEWPDGRVHLVDGADHDELRRWAAVQRPPAGRPRTCRPERVAVYLERRPGGATADQVAYALGVSERRVTAILRILEGLGVVVVARDPGPPTYSLGDPPAAGGEWPPRAAPGGR